MPSDAEQSAASHHLAHRGQQLRGFQLAKQLCAAQHRRSGGRCCRPQRFQRPRLMRQQFAARLQCIQIGGCEVCLHCGKWDGWSATRVPSSDWERRATRRRWRRRWGGGGGRHRTCARHSSLAFLSCHKDPRHCGRRTRPLQNLALHSKQIIGLPQAADN